MLAVICPYNEWNVANMFRVYCGKKGFADVHMDFKKITYLNIICKTHNIDLNIILDCSRNEDWKSPIYDMKVDDIIYSW